MNWAAYSEYKASQVDWLGDLPAHWRTKPLWSMFTRIKNTGFPDEPMLSVYRDHGVILKDSRDDNLNKTADNRNIYQLVEPGWLVTNRMKAWQGSVGISSHRGIASGHYICFRPEHAEVDSYLNYLLRSDRYVAGYQMLSRGVRPGQAEIDNDLYRSMPVVVPPREEQLAIAHFLNGEIAKIDVLIGKQERLIAILREDRAAVITQAVTEGIDSNISMTDPTARGRSTTQKGWKVVPLVRCVNDRVDYRGSTPTKVADGVPLVTARNIRAGWIDYDASEEYVSADEYDEIMRRGRPQIGDVVFTMEAPLGNVALVDRTDIALAQRVVKFRADPKVAVARYLMYSIMSTWFQSQLETRATGSTALGLKASKLPELRIAMPGVSTQAKIVRFLDEHGAEIDALVAKASEVIQVLREFRSALITDAVTGKIDVREA